MCFELERMAVNVNNYDHLIPNSFNIKKIWEVLGVMQTLSHDK